MPKNWELIKTAYVTSDKNMEEVANDFKVNFAVLRRHAAADHWVEQRKIFRVTTTKQASEKRSSEMASDIAQYSADELKLVRAGLALIAEEMKNRKSARGIAAALKVFQEVRMRATGEETNRSESSQQVVFNVVDEETKRLTERLVQGERPSHKGDNSDK